MKGLASPNLDQADGILTRRHSVQIPSAEWNLKNKILTVPRLALGPPSVY